jgi:hypothetical protein
VHDFSFTYRGQREIWSTTYHLSSQPPLTADWITLSTAVWNMEKLFLASDVQVEGARGYNAGEPPILVWEDDVSPPGQGGIPGTFVPPGGSNHTPGDAAGWIRYTTTQKTSRGKPIYLRNYYHGMYTDANGDTIVAAQLTAMSNLATQWVTGFSVSGVLYRRAGPRGAIAQGHAQSAYVTTRTLKRRGKRHRITQQQLIDYIKSQGVGDAPVLVP